MNQNLYNKERIIIILHIPHKATWFTAHHRKTRRSLASLSSVDRTNLQLSSECTSFRVAVALFRTNMLYYIQYLQTASSASSSSLSSGCSEMAPGEGIQRFMCLCWTAADDDDDRYICYHFVDLYAKYFLSGKSHCTYLYVYVCSEKHGLSKRDGILRDIWKDCILLVP